MNNEKGGLLQSTGGEIGMWRLVSIGVPNFGIIGILFHCWLSH